MKAKVTVKLNSADQVLQDAGLLPGGAIQTFHTQNVLRRIQKYMPFKSGALIKTTIAQTDVNKPEVVTDLPQGKFLFHGKLMVSDVTGSAWARKGETKHVVNVDLKYNQGKNALAGARWDEALLENEEAILTSELQSYIDLRARRQL